MLLVFPFVFGFLFSQRKKNGLEERKKQLSQQFLDAMRVVSTALLAGLSAENAWREAQKEIEVLYGKEAIMFCELQEMNQSIRLSVPVEKVLDEFAQRTGIEDIVSFAEVFLFAKRCGGDFVKIIEHTTEHMRSKLETEQEIDVLIAAKRLEQKIMNLVPIFILAYLRISSDGYLDVLYSNWLGRIFMCICLIAYVFAIFIAKRVMAIKI